MASLSFSRARLVWSDMRTTSICEDLIERVGGGNRDFLRERCGLPISTYFSATKILWLLRNVPEVQSAVERQSCLFGTVDTWLVWVSPSWPAALCQLAVWSYDVFDARLATRI